MELIVLGSGTTTPHADRGCAAHALVANDGSILLLDCGPGSSRRYPLVGIDPERIVGVVNTHHHADHCAELPLLLFFRNVREPPIASPIVLAGPVGHRRFVDSLVGAFAAGLAYHEDSTSIIEMRNGENTRIGPFDLAVREVAHIPGALGLSVAADGTRVVFSGDTGPCEALESLCRGADLALLECSYAASRVTASHLTTASAGATAVAAGISRLVLTHFYPECLEVDRVAEVRASGYFGELVLATDGTRIEVSAP